MWHCSKLCTYTTIITTITILSLFLSAYSLFASRTCTLFFTQLRYSNTQLLPRLIDYNWFSSAMSPFYSPTRSVEPTFLNWKVRVLEKFITTVCICTSHLFVPYACCYWFIWIVFDAFASVFAYVYLMLILFSTYF